MKVLLTGSLILLATLVAPASIAEVGCTSEAADLFARGSQAEREGRATDARSLYTEAAQQCDRSDYWMTVGNVWFNDSQGDSDESQKGGPANKAYKSAFSAAVRDGNSIEAAAAARAMVKLGLHLGDPLTANDWLVLAQNYDPSNPALAELQQKVDNERGELSTSEIKIGLDKTRGIDQVPNSAQKNFQQPPEFQGPQGGTGANVPATIVGAETDTATSIKGFPINFEYNSIETTDQTHKNIESLATVLVTDTKGTIVLIGHADSRGDADYNMELSRNRADAIRIELESLQPSLADRISVVGRGELEPIDPGNSERAYANNRRLELVVKD